MMINFPARRWWTRAVVCATAVVVGAAVVTGPASAAEFEETDVSLEIGVRHDGNRTTISVTVRNEGPLALTESFTVIGLAPFRRTLVRPVDRCTLNSGFLECQMFPLGQPGSFGSITLEFSGPSPCGRGCDFDLRLGNQDALSDADLDPSNDRAFIVDGFEV